MTVPAISSAASSSARESYAYAVRAARALEKIDREILHSPIRVEDRAPGFGFGVVKYTPPAARKGTCVTGTVT